MTTFSPFCFFQTLLDFGQSPNCRDRGGLTPLYVNILCDPDKRICHRLLYEHSEIGVSNTEGLQEIHQASAFFFRFESGIAFWIHSFHMRLFALNLF